MCSMLKCIIVEIHSPAFVHIIWFVVSTAFIEKKMKNTSDRVKIYINIIIIIYIIYIYYIYRE